MAIDHEHVVVCQLRMPVHLFACRQMMSSAARPSARVHLEISADEHIRDLSANRLDRVRLAVDRSGECSQRALRFERAAIGGRAADGSPSIGRAEDERAARNRQQRRRHQPVTEVVENC